MIHPDTSLAVHAAVALAFEEMRTRKWTTNLCTEIQKCIPTKTTRETNDAFRKHLPLSPTFCILYVVGISSMILHTGRFLCLRYVEIFLDPPDTRGYKLTFMQNHLLVTNKQQFSTEVGHQ